MRLQILAFLAAAVLILGMGYFWVSRDITKKEIPVITKLAEGGHIEAQRHLGMMYEKGKGVDRHDVKARQWYEKAATQNDSHAQRQLGFMYERGVGGSKDIMKAKEWYEKAAAQDDTDAQILLGIMYEEGREDFPKNLVKAKEWYEKAAEQGEMHAATSIGRMYEQGQDDFPQDYANAHEWYKQAALKGDVDAQYSLGVFYLLGQGVHKDHDKAIKWFEKAALDSVYYQNKLGDFYNYGDEKAYIRPQYAKAREWYEKAASKDHIISQLTLAKMYEKGTGIRQDKTKAKEWYGKACDLGQKHGCEDYRRLNEETP